ncbi:tetratricopeptide repeat protein [Roseomonas sp. HF4]|uniref:tetratricopeptide repeat protein n=1 Tax=Roseomonas sp. HF4 TaxID=2562313 RepID=UPI0010BF840D|nr:tetratricopeptide repeat protein [Roseomonas sp. HF4]
MLRDRYGNEVATSSSQARDLYITALDSLLAGAPRMATDFEQVVETDPGFALGHCGLARARAISGDGAGARTAIAEARRLADGLPDKQRSHINAVGLLIDGKAAEAGRAVRAHVAEHPRDALVAQICTSVFGLIGFSGQPGREAELLAYTASLLPHYGEDWWCLSQHAFSLCEVGRIDEASATVDRSLALNPRNAHAAHVRSHASYEAGDRAAGLAYLRDWLEGYDRRGLLHGHLSWHVALWALEQGDIGMMWQIIDADVAPGAAKGLPINVLTDTASILYRAELAGEPVSPDRWRQVSAYAKQFFPKASLAFVDVHVALAHAMAGDTDALASIVANPAGPAASLVRAFAEAYGAIARQSWEEATAHLTDAMADHARIGGSRAQRDLLEFTLLGVLLRQGHAEEARRLLALRRPALAGSAPVRGLHS